MKRKWFKWKRVSIALLSAIALTVPTAVIAVSCSDNESSSDSSSTPPPSLPPSSSGSGNTSSGGHHSSSIVEHYDLDGKSGKESYKSFDGEPDSISFLSKEKEEWDFKHILWYKNNKPIT